MKPTADSGEQSRDSLQANLIELESLKETISAIPKGVKNKTETLEALRIITRAAALPAHYDAEVIRAITDQLGEHPSSGVMYRESIKSLRSERRAEKVKAKKGKPPTREVYFQLFEQILGPLPRDVFSGKCMVKHDNLWEPAQNFIHRVKSEVYDLQGVGLDMSISAVDSHFFEYEVSKERSFIPTVPEWDNVDRIKQIADCVTLDGSQDFPASCVEQFFKSWMAGIFLKMEDPSHQNPVLILKGPQGIGKDVLVDTLTGGFGQWSKDLILSHNDKDNYTQLSRAAVLRISEFERTSKTDLSTIKDMIFRKFTFLRPSHQPEFKDAQCRASFVASCNTDDIYRDSTGNRRYVVFNVEALKWNYDRSAHAQAQIMAQARVLALEAFSPSQMNLDAMARFLETKTPESAEAISVETWVAEAERWIQSNTVDAQEIIRRGWMTNEEAQRAGLFEKSCKALGIAQKTFRQHLKSEGMGIMLRADGAVKRGYSLKFEPSHMKQIVTDENDRSDTDIDF